jgi:hypothetical protein
MCVSFLTGYGFGLMAMPWSSPVCTAAGTLDLLWNALLAFLGCRRHLTPAKTKVTSAALGYDPFRRFLPLDFISATLAASSCLWAAIIRSWNLCSLSPSILMMQAAQNWLGDHFRGRKRAHSAIASRQSRLNDGGNTWTEGTMRPASVVMRDPLTEDPPQVAVTERDHIVQTFATDCPDQSFAMSVGEGQLHRMVTLLILTNFEITHPHHPLRGQRFELVTYRQNWGEDRVYFHNADGRLSSIPACWTTVVAPDPFVAVAGGRCLFRYEDLLQLVALMEKLR